MNRKQGIFFVIIVYGADINEITGKLNAIGYQYDEKLNQFR